MQNIIILKAEDIVTINCGLNYSVKPPGSQIELNFTKEAIIELYNDMLGIDEEFKKVNGKYQKEFYEVAVK